MKLLIAAGGTGGHLYPGIAIAREALKTPGSTVMFAGTAQGIEARVLPKEGLPHRFITAGKLKGMGLGAALRTLIQLPVGIIQSLRLIRETAPDVVIGIGGYASGPVGLAAWLLRVPLMIVEPNSHAGLANRQLGRLANTVALCFPGTGAARFFEPRKTVQLGPLVRSGIAAGNRDRAIQDFGLDRGRKTIFIMGGSGGARAINDAMPKAAALIEDRQRLQFLHQTGEKDAASVTEAYRAAGIQAMVTPFIHDMAGAYAAADVIVARSGATTIAELAVCGKRAVLVPFPFAADNHQEFNARTLAQRGAAEVIIQRDLTPERLADAVRTMMQEEKTAQAPMQDTAAKEIIRICQDYVQTH